jgi:hypothetical protein
MTLRRNYMSKSPRELAARALCKLNGHPPDIKMDGSPMWESYLDEVDAKSLSVAKQGNPMTEEQPKKKDSKEELSEEELSEEELSEEELSEEELSEEELSEEELKDVSGGKRARCPGTVDLIRGDVGMPAARPGDTLEPGRK